MSGKFGLIVCIGILVLILFLYFKFVKHIRCGCMTLITGGVKTGKSTLSVATSIREFRIVHFKWRIRYFFCKILRKPLPEEPYYYSNVPIKVKGYHVLELDHLLRKKRLHYKSVVYIQEAALVCDSQLIRSQDINNNLNLFFCLFGHETRGGKIFIDCQSITNLHYGIKRNMSNYVYIHHIKKIPFFILCYVRELIHSEDNNNINVFTKDIEEDLKFILIPKSTWKKFDAYSFSSLTDYLDSKAVKKDITDKDLKVENVISFRPEFNMSVAQLIEKEKKQRSENEKR